MRKHEHPRFFQMCGDLVARIIKFAKPDEYGATRENEGTEVELEDANLITSLYTFGRHLNDGKGIHKVVLDIDMDAMLIPSTTPGHHHLIIDKALDWPDYVKVMDVLADVGIVEKGYVRAAKQKGYTGIRVPWVKKEPGDPRRKSAFAMTGEGW